MKTILFIFLFVTSFSFSQNKEFTFKEIDSICNLARPSIQSSGEITLKKKNSKKIIGTGGFSITIYKSHDKLEVLKAFYNENIEYKNSFKKEIFGQFYYKNNQLFYIKIEVVRTEKNKDTLSENFIYTIEELNDTKAIKNVLLFDVQSWVSDKNKEILDLYNQK